MSNETVHVPVSAEPKTEKKGKKKSPVVAKNKSDTKRLPKAQIRVLAALAKSKTSLLSVRQIAERADVPKTHISGFVFVATKAKRSPALGELGYVKERILDVDGKKERCAEITAAGKKALEKSKG